MRKPTSDEREKLDDFWNSSYNDYKRLEAENLELKARWDRLKETMRNEIRHQPKFLQIVNGRLDEAERIRNKIQELESSGESPDLDGCKEVTRDMPERMRRYDRIGTPKPEKKVKQEVEAYQIEKKGK